MATTNINSKPSQDFVPINEVRDGVIILKNGSMRALLLVTSLNFSLKSADEQTSIIYQFQNLLNSLDFSLQIAVESKRLDIRPYLATLEDRYKVQLSDIMKVQIREYINFIKNFTNETKIMAKNFYVAIPYDPAYINTNAKGGVFKQIFSSKKESPKEKNLSFEENRMQLEQRVGSIQQGLSRCGLRSAVLGTDEMVELFYRMFNPGDTEKPIKFK